MERDTDAMTSQPRPLFSNWEQLKRAVTRQNKVILFTDFDGTLVPIRNRPGDVWLRSATRQRLLTIVGEGTVVGIISGRGLSDLRRRAAVPGAWYAGAHGYFLCSPRGRRISLLSHRSKIRMDGLLKQLRRTLKRLPGIQIEPKDATIAVHYRRASKKSAKAAETQVRAAVSGSRAFRLMHGKKVWEILPNERIDKWAAVQFILRKVSRGNRRAAFVYLGDDTTDEAVFRVGRGVSVIVGSRRPTAAKYSLRSTEEVDEFLNRWAELRG